LLKIYHAAGTRSVRPIWLCFELDLPVEIETIDFSPTFRNSAPWRAISPAGKLPVMTDGDMTMFESGAMIDYILERYGEGRLRPSPGSAQSAMHHQWCWFSEATLARPLGLNRLLGHSAAGGESVSADAVEKTRTCLGVVDRAVSDRDFLLRADFGAADVMMGYSLELLTSLQVLDDRYPNTCAYMERLRGRKAFKRAMSA
jgi:glutathione S-transferase